MLSRLLFNVFFAYVTHAVALRYSEDPDIVRDFVHLEKDLDKNAAGVYSDRLHVYGGKFGACFAPMMQELCLGWQMALPR